VKVFKFIFISDIQASDFLFTPRTKTPRTVRTPSPECRAPLRILFHFEEEKYVFFHTSRCLYVTTTINDVRRHSLCTRDDLGEHGDHTDGQREAHHTEHEDQQPQRTARKQQQQQQKMIRVSLLLQEVQFSDAGVGGSNSQWRNI